MKNLQSWVKGGIVGLIIGILMVLMPGLTEALPFLYMPYIGIVFALNQASAISFIIVTILYNIVLFALLGSLLGVFLGWIKKPKETL